MCGGGWYLAGGEVGNACGVVLCFWRMVISIFGDVLHGEGSGEGNSSKLLSVDDIWVRGEFLTVEFYQFIQFREGFSKAIFQLLGKKEW